LEFGIWNLEFVRILTSKFQIPNYGVSVQVQLKSLLLLRKSVLEVVADPTRFQNDFRSSTIA